jgi:hypothetical protein
MNIDLSYHERHKIYVDYLLLKVVEKDWHGVSDAANDLRELEREYTTLESIKA